MQTLTRIDWLSIYEERAAIMEYDGGLHRTVAQARAWAATAMLHAPCPNK